MKNPASSTGSSPADGNATVSMKAAALEPSEITVTLDSPETQFEPLPKDLAPTRTVPEESVHPECRSGESVSEESPTLATPARDLAKANTDVATFLASRSPRASTTPSKSAGKARWFWLVLGTAVILAVASVAGFSWWKTSRAKAVTGTSDPVSLKTTEPVPPALRTYLEQAQTGDAKSMHMIALMYWNGLNVRQDRAKGLEWYRKAATAGSPAAAKFLQDNGLK